MNPERSLADKPGERMVESRELQGHRFTALGQLGVDVAYYVASPTDTPRHTLRCSEKYAGQPCCQDLLHLQMPGDGAYFVALFPRRRGEPIPTFGTLGDGKIIKVNGDFGVDYGFLSAVETTGDGEAISFRGTAASVQDRHGGLLSSLGGKGEVRYQQYGLSGEQAASLRVGERLLTLELPNGNAGAAVTVTAPGVWRPDASAGDVKLTVAAEGRLALTVPKGVTRMLLKR